MKEKLKIGIITNGLLIPSWAYYMLKKIHESNHSKIVLIVQMEYNHKERIWNIITQTPNLLFWKLYERLDLIKYKKSSSALILKDLRELLNTDIINIVSGQKNDLNFINDDALKIKKYGIDVLIRISDQKIKGRIFDFAKYGIWSFYFGDIKKQRGFGPEGAWEVLDNINETGVTLEMLNENDRFIIARSSSRTDYISISRNRNNLYWNNLQLLPQKLEDLYDLGGETFLKNLRKVDQTPYFYSNQLFGYPRNGQLISRLLKKIKIVLKRKVLDLFYFDQWILLYAIDKKEGLSKSFYNFIKMLPPKDRDWADPFLIEKGNTYYIFIEEFIYKNGKAHLSVIEMDKSGKYSEPKIILEKSYHLSYPFIFEDNGIFYMIPETNESNRIELYKSVDFPLKWEFITALMNDVSAVDTTILKKDGKYWLFSNIKDNKNASFDDKLYLFYSDNLYSNDWIPHPKNPIVMDVKKARPAGNLILLDGQIYRISQNCSNRYGYGMTVSHITILDEYNYEEELVDSIYPNWEKNLMATHTLNFTGGLTIIDAQIRRRK